MTSTELYQTFNKLRKQKKGIVTYLTKKGFDAHRAHTLSDIYQEAKTSKEFTELYNKIAANPNAERDAIERDAIIAELRAKPGIPRQELLDLQDKKVRVEIRDNVADIKGVLEDKVDETGWKSDLKFTKKYVYNTDSDQYIIYVKAANGNVVISGHIIRSIMENYSNWISTPRSVNEICRNYRIPRAYFNEIKEALELTHDSEPVSKERLIVDDIDAITDDILERKKFQLSQNMEKKSWSQTEEAAHKWYSFIEGVYNPFETFIDKWVPPVYQPVAVPQQVKGKAVKVNRSFIVGLSDIHFGAYSNPKNSFRGKGVSTDDTVAYMKKYAQDIASFVEDRSYTINECVLASLGDILHTSGRGFTTKGTMLSYDRIKEDQFDAAFNSLIEFVNNLLELFPKVRVKSVKGNHNDFGDYILFKALAAYYRTEKRIEFEVFQSDHGLFRINDSVFIISHGYSAEYKGRLPNTGKARESYVANLFLSKADELHGVKSKIFITADQHHSEMKEYAEFEHYMLSTAVKGDQHSESMGLNNIPKQSCFVIDNIGVKEIIHSHI